MTRVTDHKELPQRNLKNPNKMGHVGVIGKAFVFSAISPGGRRQPSGWLGRMGGCRRRKASCCPICWDFGHHEETPAPRTPGAWPTFTKRNDFSSLTAAWSYSPFGEGTQWPQFIRLRMSLILDLVFPERSQLYWEKGELKWVPRARSSHGWGVAIEGEQGKLPRPCACPWV